MSTGQNSPGSLPEICAPREELIHIFDQCAEKPYIFVQAPAGYGKTISALLWLKKTKYPFAWLTLDKYDNIISLFYRSLCHCLLSAVPHNRATSQFVNSLSFSTSPVESTLEFLSMLSWNEKKHVLVLDDLHTITNEEILKSLPYVFKRLPVAINVLILSRTVLPNAMNIMKESGQTAFIGSTNLAFSPEEIRKHYASYGRFITKQEASVIYSYTDGWAIILNAMVSKGGLNLIDDNHSPSLEGFFFNNIWNGFDQATQIFLMKTSVVDSFTLELCELLTESLDCAEILDSLIRGNINLSRIGQEYRYHHLFLEFLRNRLEKSGIMQSKLFHAATSYYMETEKFYLAVICSLRGDNKEIESQVIGNFFQSKNPTLDQFYELASAYSTLSKEQCDEYPIRYMPNILAAFLSGDVDKTKRLFDLFYAALPAFLDYKHPIGDVAVTRLILDFRIKLADLPDFIDSLGIKRDKKVPGQAALVTVQMPMLYRSVRDFYEFLNPNTQDTVQELFSCLLPNDYQCFHQSVTSGLLMEQNRLNEGLDAAVNAYNNITEVTSNEVYFGVAIGLAEICMLKSEKERYQSILYQLHQWIDKNRTQYLLKNLMAYEERAKLEDGDKKAAEDWLKNYFVNDSSCTEFYKIYQTFTTARAYIVLSMPSQAMAVLEQLKKLGIGFNRPLDIAEAEVLATIVEWTWGQKNEARDRLYSLLLTLQPYGFIRIVANEGKSIFPVLSAIIKKLNQTAEENKGFYRYVKEVRAAAYEQSKRLKGLTHNTQLVAVRLSPKQTLVLELLAKGYKNAEIVEFTGLSLNTIRTHTKIAYQKLEVTNALDAVAKATQLGIINNQR